MNSSSGKTLLILENHELLRLGLVGFIKNSSFQPSRFSHFSFAAFDERFSHDFNPDIVLFGTPSEMDDSINQARKLVSLFPTSSFIVLLNDSLSNKTLGILLKNHTCCVMFKSEPSETLEQMFHYALKKQSHLSNNVILKSIWVNQNQVNSNRKPINNAVELLSAREKEVYQLLCLGLAAKEIAQTLKIDSKTAYNHKYNILNRLGYKSHAELIIAAERGLKHTNRSV